MQDLYCVLDMQVKLAEAATDLTRSYQVEALPEGNRLNLFGSEVTECDYVRPIGKLFAIQSLCSRFLKEFSVAERTIVIE